MIKMLTETVLGLVLAAVVTCAFPASAQMMDGPPEFPGDEFSPGGPPPGGPGGMQSERKLVKDFDKDGDGWLNQAERKAARESIKQQGGNRGFGGPGGRRPGFGGRQQRSEQPQPGQKLTPAEVNNFPGVPLYASNVLRTIFLEFENADWEQELAAFKNTDVEVPAKLTVDGKTYDGVGVHFHGMSSYMMVGEGQKRSLVLTMNFIHPDQQLDGYNKLNLLNSHEDPSFLRTVMGMQIAREYSAAPKANFVRVVINGESWGVYVNQQHFDKDFTKDAFGSKKGARWKVPGSPNGHGGMAYLGEDAEAYKRIYEIKSKDDPKSWAALARLCKVLNETPSGELEKALAPMLDIDGVLKFLAWENALSNGDGFWARASDYCLYLDLKGVFHVVPYDANETFSAGGGPGGPGGFGPGMILAERLLDEGDKNGDGKLSKEEFTAAVEAWFKQLDPKATGALTQEQFTAQLGELLPAPPGFGPQRNGQDDRAGGRPGGRQGGGPAMFLGPALFSATDSNKDGKLTKAEFTGAFSKWFSDWDTAKTASLTEENLQAGMNATIPRPNFGGMGRRGGGGGGVGGGGRGLGGMPGGGGGVELKPLAAANDASKPLASKLLAVPALRSRYLGYVRDIAERWLDWKSLGPVAEHYHALIAKDVAADTRKLDSTAAFNNSLTGQASKETGVRRGPIAISLKDFADKRRAYLLSNDEVGKATTPVPGRL